MKRSRLFALIVGLLILDQVTKTWAVSALKDGDVIELVGSLQFNLGYNSGIAFSQAQDLGVLVGIVGLVAVGLLIRAMWRAPHALGATGFALIVAGAAGNLSDRIFRGDGWLHGRVVDFIDLQWWPIFNVADSAISVGAVVLIYSLVRDYRAENQKNVTDES